jgi:diguanylate cyclase (GGDEF)-like protein
MRRVAAAVAGGDFQRRLAIGDSNELGQFAVTFNHMLDQLENQHSAQIAAEHDATIASDEARFHERLAGKDHEIEETNRELKARIHELTALFQLNQALVTTFDLQIVFERTLNTLKEVTLCREMVLLLCDAGKETLEVRKTLGFDPAQIKGTVYINQGIAGLAARTGEMQYVRDVSREGSYVDFKGRANPMGSMVVMPLSFKGELLGLLELHKDRPNAFSGTDLKLIQAAGNQLAMAIENTRLHEMTRSLANNDELTGLANRRYFHEILKRELAQAARFQSNFCLIMADIDNFQHFNDSFGRLNGDVALRRIATLLLQNTRGIDLVARFGGEEFLILLSRSDKADAVGVADKLRQTIANENFPVSGAADGSARLTLSLGVVEYPSDSRDIYELLDLADRALLCAKEEGHDRVFACAPETLRSHPTPTPAKD